MWKAKLDTEGFMILYVSSFCVKKKKKEKKEYYTKSKSDTCAEEKWNKFKVISVWSPIQAAASSPGSFHYTPHLWLPERAPIY